MLLWLNCPSATLLAKDLLIILNRGIFQIKKVAIVDCVVPPEVESPGNSTEISRIPPVKQNLFQD
jgi:hypothetical protein